MVQRALTCMSSWLSTYGFEFTNRELAGIAWLVAMVVLIIVLAVLKQKIRSSLYQVLRMTFSPKLTVIWIVYVLWIMSFVLISAWVGLWRAILTKDTVVWSVTAGLALLVGFPEAKNLGYFRQELLKIVSIIVIFEYIVNFASFSFWSELIIQPLIFIFLVAPIIVDDPEQREAWHRGRIWFFAILGIVTLAHTIRILYSTRQTVDWELFALQAVWPILLGIWVLILVFPLAIISSYEEAFIKLRLYRTERKGLWKAKLGLVMALGVRLRLIREAAKGGTKDVADAESVGAAYEAAKRYKTEIDGTEGHSKW
ncbi:hypothetical protein ACFQPA_11760 [Halomarina halobia]|uniref:Uncharacterized protein n=1 Tax=Halomarina halobia TaxID=3033386 RepID=A0ABD6AA01_9EURY|nr:hypothetical protein [Halomarina sp. PSR21]